MECEGEKVAQLIKRVKSYWGAEGRRQGADKAGDIRSSKGGEKAGRKKDGSQV